MTLPQTDAGRSQLATWLYALVVACFCAWALSMPVFPSQDGPLHLYYVNIFRQLLTHTPGVYSDNFFINRYVPPYSLYYYGLIALGTVMPLPMADKLIVCSFFLVFAMGVRALCRVVSGEAVWAPFLALPILINWSLMMGFVNYSLGTGIACFALAVWCGTFGKASLRRRAAFLGLLVMIVLTHPVPWMFAVGFAYFDLGLRVVRYWLAKDKDAARPVLAYFGRDLATALLGSTPYLYLLHFSNSMQIMVTDEPLPVRGFIEGIKLHIDWYNHLMGLIVFIGEKGWPVVDRVLLTAVFLLAVGAAVTFAWRAARAGRWAYTETWTVFAVCFFLAMPFIPEMLNGSFYFAWRLMSLLFLSGAIAASGAMRSFPRVRLPLAGLAVLSALVTLGMAIVYIRPVAQDISTLKDVPAIPAGKPGLLIAYYDADDPYPLNYDPLYWAGSHYYRSHNQLMFNTGWLELNIIPVKPKPEALKIIDSSFFVQRPEFEMRLMRDENDARHTLSRVGSAIVVTPRNLPKGQHPFAEEEESAVPGDFAKGWSCQRTDAWAFCTPDKQP